MKNTFGKKLISTMLAIILVSNVFINSIPTFAANDQILTERLIDKTIVTLSASSEFTGGFVASNANDGLVGADNDSEWHSKNLDKNDWIEATFAESKSLSRIIIFGRDTVRETLKIFVNNSEKSLIKDEHFRLVQGDKKTEVIFENKLTDITSIKLQGYNEYRGFFIIKELDFYEPTESYFNFAPKAIWCSSAWNANGASYATDGSLDTMWHSESGANNRIVLNLGNADKYYITGVTLHTNNRTAKSDIKIYIFDTLPTDLNGNLGNPYVTVTPNGKWINTDGHHLNIEFEKVVDAKFIVIESDGDEDGFFQLNEITVTNFDTTFPLTAIAASSALSSNYGYDKATDGIFTDNNEESMWHTSADDTERWIILSLGSIPYYFDKVTLYTHTGRTVRWENTIEIYTSVNGINDEDFSLVMVQGGKQESVQSLEMGRPILAKYIKIKSQGDGEFFALREVAIKQTDAPKESSVKSICGDLNINGKVDSLDLILMRKVLLGLEEFELSVADLNGDGGVNILDLIKLKKMLAGENLSVYDEKFDYDLYSMIYGELGTRDEYPQVYGIATYSPNPKQNYANSFPIETQTFSLSMNESGVIDSLRIKSTGEEAVTSDGERGRGFLLHQCKNDGSGEIEKTYSLDKVYFDNSGKIPLLIATTKAVPKGLSSRPILKIAVQYTDKYIIFTLMSLTGYPINDYIKLEFEQKVSSTMFKGMALDYMTDSLSISGFVWDNPSESIKSPLTPSNLTGNPLGKFAYYVYESAEDEDDTIMQMWVNENLPRPYVENNGEKWTLSTAKKWLAGWIEELGIQGRSIIYPEKAVSWDGDTPIISESTKKLVQTAKDAGTKILYFYSSAWHSGSEFEYVNTKAAEINTDYFVARGSEDDIYMKVPEEDGSYSIIKADSIAGSASMAALAEYCNKNGIYLGIHTTAGGLGRYSSWFGENRHSEIPGKLETGVDLELVEDISENDMTVTLRPRVYTNVDGSKFSTPYQIEKGNGQGTSGRFGAKYPLYPDSFSKYTDELQFIDKDGNSEICRFDKNSRIDNGDGTWTFTVTERAVKGTAKKWNAGTIAGNVATAYNVYAPDSESDLLYKSALNLASLANKAKIAQIEFDSAENHCINGNYGYQKYASYVYSLCDHYVTSHDSGNTNPEWFMEFKFNCVQEKVNVGNEGYGELYNEMAIREGVRPYQANYLLGSAVGASAANKLGLFGERNNTMFAVSPNYLENGLANDVIETVSDFVNINKLLTESQRKIIFDAYFAQCMPFSHGVHLSAYTVFDIRKMYDAYNSLKGYNIVPITVMTRAGNVDAPFYSATEYGANCPQQYIKSGTTLRLSNVYEEQEPKFILRNLYATDYSDNSSTTVYNGSITLKATNNNNNSVTSGRYLESQWGYTNISTNVDLSKQSAIGMWITGDGSGSTVILQSGNGNSNYVFEVDFVGKKYVEVPNPLASYASKNWGMNDERRENAHAPGNSGGFKIAIGKIPANTSVNIVVSDIKAITNVSQKLVDPVITLENGSQMRIDTSNVDINAKDYIRYMGEKNADGTAKIYIYDGNWNNKRETKGYITGDFKVKNGYSDITVTSDMCGSNATNWISTQFTTESTGNQIMFIECD